MKLPSVILAPIAAAMLLPACTPEPGNEPPRERRFASNDPIERACDLDGRLIARIWRGHHPVHSEDVTIVPQPPNYSGSFNVTSHSGPWDYLQTVPLVLYGPAIARSGQLDEEATVADIYPTVGELLGVELEDRDGSTLTDAIDGGPGRPKLIVLVVWDGVGRNVLQRWPDDWPNLARLERDGTSYVRATVGSSPSITPATHATMGTGAFPRDHEVTAIEYRDDGGSVRGVYRERDPSDLALTTFGDDVDLGFGNRSKVGMVAWKSWHFGMFGHGSRLAGGDRDDLVLIGSHGRISGNPEFYSTPDYLEPKQIFDRAVEELDLRDGERDGRWRGRDIAAMHDNPAWVGFEEELTLRLLSEEGYGRDEIPDIFVTNYKVTDIVSHQHSIDSPEMQEALRAQDETLGRLIDYLDDEVGDYALILTSDHGNTPPARATGAWPLLQGQLEEDVNERFEVRKGRSLIEATTAVGPFLDRKLARRLGVSAADVARFLNSYTIADNWGGDELPEGYEGRGREHVLSAAFPADRIDDVARCAFGSPRPPRRLGS